MDEIEIRNDGRCIICLNGDLSRTYKTMAEAPDDAKPEERDIIVIMGGGEPPANGRNR